MIAWKRSETYSAHCQNKVIFDVNQSDVSYLWSERRVPAHRARVAHRLYIPHSSSGILVYTHRRFVGSCSYGQWHQSFYLEVEWTRVINCARTKLMSIGSYPAALLSSPYVGHSTVDVGTSVQLCMYPDTHCPHILCTEDPGKSWGTTSWSLKNRVWFIVKHLGSVIVYMQYIWGHV